MAQYSSYGWWGTDAGAPRGLGHLTNQYAAMPSLHVGWSLWCGLMLFRLGRHWLARTLGIGYPVVTTLVVLGTVDARSVRRHAGRQGAPVSAQIMAETTAGKSRL